MENICRLCCSERFVNNYIFDEENALHLKMSLYLPIKILKDDLLPQKICDKCSCKVNDFYQFCNESIEAQNKLQLALPKSLSINSKVSEDSSVKSSCALALKTAKSELVDQCTQTDGFDKDKTPPPSNDLMVPLAKVKEEPIDAVKQEESLQMDLNTFDADNYDSDSSENISLIKLKYSKDEKKNRKNQSETNDQINNIENTVPRRKHSSLRKTENGTKKTHKRKHSLENNLDNLAPFMNAIPKGTSIAVVQDKMSQELKIEMKEEVQEVEPDDLGIELNAKCKLSKKIKKEQDQVQFACCVCYTECYSRKEMLAHYRSHADLSQLRGSPPPAPPPPAPASAPPAAADAAPASTLATCPRCKKVVSAGVWAGHWRRHWELDRRPYRCSRCHATFRDHNAIFKHGLRCRVKKQKASDPFEVRYVCDLCPEQFEYLKCLKAHRNQAHPEVVRPLRLACSVCGRGFLHLNSLRRHVRAHSGRRDYLCNVCGKGLSSAEHLKSHIQIHENVKPNVCKTCGKAFVKKTNLTMHERVHSGEKPYVCEHCGKCFSQRSTLVIHERYHSGARPYVCKLCGRGFVARGLLSMHLKVACI